MRILGEEPASIETRIGGLPWVAALSQAAAEAHREIGEVRRVERGTTVVREGAPAEDVFSVVEGALMVEKERLSGGSQVIGFLFHGDVFGVVHEDCYSYGVRAAVPCELVAFPRPAFEKICEDHPCVQRAMLRMAGNELASAQDHLVILGRKTAVERVASFLQMLMDRNTRVGASSEEHVWLPMRRADIANYLGLTLETFSRVFTELKRRGVVQAESMRLVRVRDPEGLRNIAEMS